MRKWDSSNAPYAGPGPFLASQLPPGSRYELRDGHALYCAPTGGDGSSRIAKSAMVLATDPAVKQAGIDPGYSFGPGDLRAPDVAVGNVPDKPGWIAGVPPLAVEYAGGGQDEGKLAEKIEDFLERGTRFIWVVRLTGPRRVEVFAKGEPMRVLVPGEELHAPGILQNPVLVDALFDERPALEATLRNLLQRQGYESLEAVRDEGHEEGREEGLALARAAILDLCEAYGVEVDDERRRALKAMKKDDLEALRLHLKHDRRWRG